MTTTSPTPLKNPIIAKLFLVSILILIALIPLQMILSLVGERQSRRESVINEVSRLWGRSQVIAGPVLTVPYRTIVKIKEDISSNSNRREEEKIQVQLNQAHFLPDTFEVTGKIVPEIRSRGIFDVVVYSTQLRINGTFPHPSLSTLKIDKQNILWDEATFWIGIPDTRGIRDALFLNWDETKLEFASGTGNHGFLNGGLHTLLPALATPSTISNGDKSHRFTFEFNLNGNDQLMFVPVGKKTAINLTSTWRDPSFSGAFLPTQREINEGGFKATWEVSHLGRSFPQHWVTQNNYEGKNLYESAFGLNLLLPVDFYQKSERSVKYGILFVLLTFMTFFLFEIFNPLRIHPIQYLMVGAALCMFYLLLLSLSEHFGFLIAYAIASVATVLLISGYGMKVLQSLSRAGIMGTILAGLYGYLYILLNLQDYSLLFGTLGLFAILTSVMYITRNVDWYAVNVQLPTNQKSPISS